MPRPADAKITLRKDFTDKAYAATWLCARGYVPPDEDSDVFRLWGSPRYGAVIVDDETPEGDAVYRVEAFTEG